MSLDKSQTKLVVVSVVLIVAAAAIAFRPRSKGEAPGQYFYDLGANKLYSEKPNVGSPTVAPSGKEGVAAAVFACGSCAKAEDRFTAYLCKNTPEYLSASREDKALTPEQMEKGTLFRAVEGGEWVTRNSAAGQALIRNVATRCPKDNTSVSCNP